MKFPSKCVKKWDVLLDDQAFSENDVFDDIENSNSQPLTEPKVEVMNYKEQEKIGFYNVRKILKHKFQQGWKFLVWWENFPVSNATWEPIKSFLQPNGSVNSVFKDYCLENNLGNVLQKALSDSCK